MKKTLLLLTLSLALQLVTGCIDCGCVPAKDIHYTQKAVTLQNMDASLAEPKISSSPSISASNYGIQIRILSDQLSSTTDRKINWGLIQTAQACSCSEDNYIAKEDIISLQIFSTSDFDSSHPKNTDLASYFKIKIYNNMVSIVDHLKEKGLNSSLLSPFRDGIFLQTPPSITGKHKFTVRVTLSDGRILEAETPEVELK